MKEKEVRLTSEEIDYLLKGTIHWEDISTRVDGPLRKPIDKAVKKDFGLEGKEGFKATERNSFGSRETGETRGTRGISEPGETRELRNFGDSRGFRETWDAKGAKGIRETNEARGTEEARERPFSSGASRNFLTRTSFDFNEDYKGVDHEQEGIEDLFEEDHPFWTGTKVYIVLSLMGCITLGTWAYFVFA